MSLNNMQAAQGLASQGLGQLYQNGINQYDANPQLTKAINRLAKALEDLKPRVCVKMGRAVV